jgi:Spy/CpxP family protein refolding chaperone
MEQFKLFNPSFRQNAGSINVGLIRLRNEMLEELAKPVSDSSYLKSLADSVGMLHSDLKKITSRYYLDIKNICTPEQQKQLELIFREVFSKDNQMGPQGPGPHGKRNRMRSQSN